MKTELFSFAPYNIKGYTETLTISFKLCTEARIKQRVTYGVKASLQRTSLIGFPLPKTNQNGR